MGLAREVKRPAGDTSCIMTREAKLDHAGVLFEGPAGSSEKEWKVWKALTAVELKL